MPCRYDGPDDTNDNLRKELNITTRLLCDICKCDAVKDYVLHEFNDLRLWWNKHWEEDEAREKREKELKELRKKQLKENIKKLESELESL